MSLLMGVSALESCSVPLTSMMQLGQRVICAAPCPLLPPTICTSTKTILGRLEKCEGKKKKERHLKPARQSDKLHHAEPMATTKMCRTCPTVGFQDGMSPFGLFFGVLIHFVCILIAAPTSHPPSRTALLLPALAQPSALKAARKRSPRPTRWSHRDMQETNISITSWDCKHSSHAKKEEVFPPCLSYSFIRKSSCCESAGRCIFWLLVGFFSTCLPT